MLTGEQLSAALMQRGRMEALPRRPVSPRTWADMVANGKKMAHQDGVPSAIADIVENYELRTRRKKDEVEFILCLAQAIAPNGGLNEALERQGIIGAIPSKPPKLDPNTPPVYCVPVPRIGPPVVAGHAYIRDFKQLMDQPRRAAAANRIHRVKIDKVEPAPNTLPSDSPREPVQGIRTSAALVEVLSVNVPYEGKEPSLMGKIRFRCRLTPKARKALSDKKAPNRYSQNGKRKTALIPTIRVPKGK